MVKQVGTDKSQRSEVLVSTTVARKGSADTTSDPKEDEEQEVGREFQVKGRARWTYACCVQKVQQAYEARQQMNMKEEE